MKVEWQTQAQKSYLYFLCLVETSSSGPSSQVDGGSQGTFQPWNPGGVIRAHTGERRLDASRPTQQHSECLFGSPCLSVYISTHMHTTSVHVVVAFALKHVPTLSQYICFFLRLLSSVAFALPASRSNKPCLLPTRTTTWSVSSPSAMHWKVE